MGLGFASALNRADASIREDVRNASTLPVATQPTRGRDAKAGGSKKPAPAVTGATIDFLLQDAELRRRCRDILLAPRDYDRVLREATTILDNRLKAVSTLKGMNPNALVGKALNPDPAKAVIVVSAEADEQEGFFNICKGIMLAFRNKTHHTLSDSFTQADALRFCGFIDTLLGVIANGDLHKERI